MCYKFDYFVLNHYITLFSIVSMNVIKTVEIIYKKTFSISGGKGGLSSYLRIMFQIIITDNKVLYLKIATLNRNQNIVLEV